MPYAVELYFDAVTESKIRALWEEFASVSSPTMRDSGARPHVSLVVCETIDRPATEQLLSGFPKTVPAFPLRFSSLGMFSAASPVVFLAPKVTPDLLALHARFHSEFAKVASHCWDHYSPALWVPHCTLAMDASALELGNARGTSIATGLPLSGTVTALGLVEFSPVKQLHVTHFAPARQT